jgi:hypothetical protein
MSTCDRCGAAFECGMADTGADQPCWCTQLPSLPASGYVQNSNDGMSSRCFCPDCLGMLTSGQKSSLV